VEKQGARFSCHSCGKEVESSPEEPPCEALKEWVSVSYWRGPGSVERYNFCSFGCLKTWVESHTPAVPEAFFKSFEQDEKQEGSDES